MIKTRLTERFGIKDSIHCAHIKADGLTLR